MILHSLLFAAPLLTGGGEEPLGLAIKNEEPGSAAAPATEQPFGSFDLLRLTDGAGMLDAMRVGGLVRAYFTWGDEELAAEDSDILGVRLNDAQIWFAAEALGYELFVKADGGEATAFPGPPSEDPAGISGDGVIPLELRDAYVRKAFSEQWAIFVGQYLCPLLASAAVEDGQLALIDRTRLGYLFSFPGAYQPGVAVTFDGGPFHAKVSVQNGADEIADGVGLVLRGEYRVGTGHHKQEGALGNEGFNGTLGVGYFEDTSDIAGDDFGRAFVVDAYTMLDAFSVAAEILSADDNLASRALGNTDDDALPYSVTAGYLLTPELEGFLRYQDLDNEADTTIVGGGVNYYVRGHSVKWQLGVSQYDDDVIDGLVVQGGLSIGVSHPPMN